MGKGQQTLRRIISEQEPRLSVETEDESNVEVSLCDNLFLTIEYDKFRHLEALRAYHGVPDNYSSLHFMKQYHAIREEVERLYSDGHAKDRAGIAVEIFAKNLDQIVIGMVWLAHRLIELAIPEDISSDVPDNPQLIRAKSVEIEEIFNGFMAAVKDQMGAITGRPPKNQVPEIISKAIQRERKGKILKAMCDMLAKNPDDELRALSVATQMKESRTTLYRWLSEADIDLEDLRIEAQKLSRKI